MTRSDLEPIGDLLCEAACRADELPDGEWTTELRELLDRAAAMIARKERELDREAA